MTEDSDGEDFEMHNLSKCQLLAAAEEKFTLKIMILNRSAQSQRG